MKKYVVTDLTRFSKPDDVCTAMIDVETGDCFRPLPYLKSDRMKELNLHPGAIIEGDLSLMPTLTNPHVEDASYNELIYRGPESGKGFKSILDKTLSPSVAEGFGVEFAPRQKHIPFGQNANCSIITVKVSPNELSIHEDEYKPGKVKASFTDATGHDYRYLSITDRGFWDFAKAHQDDDDLEKVEQFILSQEEVYLRVGVSRRWQVGDRDGFWLQVNGIYSFPSFYKEIRTY